MPSTDDVSFTIEELRAAYHKTKYPERQRVIKDLIESSRTDRVRVLTDGEARSVREALGNDGPLKPTRAAE